VKRPRSLRGASRRGSRNNRRVALRPTTHHRRQFHVKRSVAAWRATACRARGERHATASRATPGPSPHHIHRRHPAERHATASRATPGPSPHHIRRRHPAERHARRPVPARRTRAWWRSRGVEVGERAGEPVAPARDLLPRPVREQADDAIRTQHQNPAAEPVPRRRATTAPAATVSRETLDHGRARRHAVASRRRRSRPPRHTSRPQRENPAGHPVAPAIVSSVVHRPFHVKRKHGRLHRGSGGQAEMVEDHRDDVAERPLLAGVDRVRAGSAPEQRAE
jgi:hypothetical protein